MKRILLMLLLGVGSTGLAANKSGVTPGGANQRASLEGCMNETLFNGVWRLMVQETTPIVRYGGQQHGYAVKVLWKNGTTKTIDALNTGVSTITLVLSDGSTLTAENDQDLKFKKLPQAAGSTFPLNFWADSSPKALAPVQKLLVEIRASGAIPSGVTYSTSTPSFRVHLDCQK